MTASSGLTNGSSTGLPSNATLTSSATLATASASGSSDGGAGGTSTTSGAAVSSATGTGDSTSSAGATQSATTATSTSSAGTSTGGSATEPSEPVTLYLAGDSTVSTYADTPSDTDQAGWGQMFAAYFDALVTVDNRAIGGRTARRFIDEGFLAEIADLIQPGDYLFVQFGTNDSNQSATYTLDGETIPYYLDPDTDFKTYLTQYLELARAHEATPVLVTPPPRNSAYCTGGNGTGAWAQAMRELGESEGAAVCDLNAKSVAYLMAICPAPSPEDFFLLRSDASVDGTHFQENGARILAGFVADGVTEANLPLAAYLE